MALTDKQHAKLLGFVDVLLTPATIERARRVEQTHTGDGKLRADMLTGEIPGYVLPMIELGQLPAPEGTDYDTLEEYINNLTGAFLPTADPTFTGTLTGPDASFTNDVTIGDDLFVSDVLTVNGNSNLGNGDADLMTTYGHQKGSGTSPGISAGAAAGSSPTLTIEGTDEVGRVSLTTGTGPTTGTLFTITWAVAYATANYSFALVPVDEDAGVMITKIGMTRTTTTLVVAASGAPVASTNHIWTYRVKEYEP